MLSNDIFALKAVYDSRQSFYGKALVIRGNNSLTLYSYQTKVAKIINGNKLVLFPAWDYSATTLRHVKEFVRQFDNFVSSKITKSDLEKLA